MGELNFIYHKAKNRVLLYDGDDYVGSIWGVYSLVRRTDRLVGRDETGKIRFILWGAKKRLKEEV